MKLRIKSMIWNILEGKNNQSEEEEKRRQKKKKDSISSLWDNFKKSYIHIIGVPGGEKEQEIGNPFEKIVKENFPNLVKETDMQVQEAQRVPNKMDANRLTPRHILIKMPEVNDKERILKQQEKRS